MPRYKALVAYDGTAYSGFQRQLDRPTIQGELEQSIDKVSRQPVTVIGAGRTDSGVHAQGQVVAFDLNWSHETDALQRALNVNLPDDIVIRELVEAAPGFHPRFDARRRAYLYNIYNNPVPHPHYRRQSWHVIRPLEIERMNDAAVFLVGEHDFATFGQPPQGDNTVRQVFSAQWQWQEPYLTFTIEANAFLYRMVRSLVGTMKLVGDGSWTVEAFVEALEARERGRAGQSAPPQGLFLQSVTY
ncbi:MAG: tRNA pseudouridine(38-40) synthase TruA [Candidatus Promineifilaceae bacterium]